jgi:hypothetical protein
MAINPDMPIPDPQPTTPSNVGGYTPSGSGSSAVNNKVIFGFGNTINDNGLVIDNLSVTSFDALATLNIPYGVTILNKNDYAPRLFSIGNVNDNLTEDVLIVYDFQPYDVTISPSIPLTVNYYENELPEGVNEQSLCMALWDDTIGYIPLETTINTEKNTLEVYISCFGKYAIIVIPECVEIEQNYELIYDWVIFYYSRY